MTDRRPRRRPGENRDRLREAGLIEFGLFGYHGASTAGIAARAGVPQPHLYTSFRTKQELFMACLADAEGRLIDRATGAPLCGTPHSQSSDDAGSEIDSASELFLLQAVAASRDPELAVPIRRTLERVRATLGNEPFYALLIRGSAFLFQ